MAQATERTNLLVEMNPPEYKFDSSIARERKRRVRQFQCCLCAIFFLYFYNMWADMMQKTASTNAWKRLLPTLLVSFAVGQAKGKPKSGGPCPNRNNKKSLFLITLVITVIYSINEEFPDNSTATSNVSDTIQPTVELFLSHSFPLSDKSLANKTIEDKELWKEAIQKGNMDLEEKDKIEQNIPPLLLRSPSYRHQRVTATTEKGRKLSRSGFVEEYATRHLYRNKSNRTLVDVVCQSGINLLGEHCQDQKIECNRFHKYRLFNGSCNNLNYPDLFGVAYTPFRRMLPPDYADGISKPRISKNGNALPSARTVSLVVHRPYYKDDPKFSVMLAVWGQFLDHDITATALSQKSNGSTISCCDSSNITSPECFPVYLDDEDPFREYNVSCIEFVRSAPVPTCCLGPREQMNQVTPFIDASVIYGVDEYLVNKLRTFENGTMKVFVTEYGHTLLPISEDMNDGCNREEEEKNRRYCFLAGDARANENLHLVSMHLLWVRQHNNIASYLIKINPNWNDEKIYQETRRIIAAQMQHITYNEFLPILLGNSLMKKFDLLTIKKGYFKKYNDSINPNIANNFATAAFRFAHSIIPGLMKLLANDTVTPEYIQMHKMLFNPFELYKSGTLDKTLRGAMNTTIEVSDSYFTNELKSHLFERSSEQLFRPKSCGLDLVSLNVQRGRDHGLPGYIEWRRHCGLKMPKNFEDLKEFMDLNSLHNIQIIYSIVDDIDLYTGALSEKPIEDGILGPTLTCLLLDQFYRIKHGDRFWYESPEKPQAFSTEQLKELRKTTLAKIICENADDLQFIQKKVMERVGTKNNYVNCSDLAALNMELWKENFLHLEINNQQILQVSAMNYS